jgi:hypothetical protein
MSKAKGLVGLGAAQLALAEGGDFRRVDDADVEAAPVQVFGQRDAVGAGGFQADVRVFAAEARQPFGEEGEACGGVVEFLVLVLAVGEAGGVEVGLGDIDADGGQEQDGGHGFPLKIGLSNNGWLHRGHAPGSALGSSRLARRNGGLRIPSELEGGCGGRGA